MGRINSRSKILFIGGVVQQVVATGRFQRWMIVRLEDVVNHLKDQLSVDT
jgi:hypothetical protein